MTTSHDKAPLEDTPAAGLDTPPDTSVATLSVAPDAAPSAAPPASPALTLAQQVDQVPTQPGCYLWKDARGQVLYVGKAKNLRARMRQYIHGTDDRVKIPFLMEQTAGFDYVVVGSEHEALVLEINLIQQYHPPYNVNLKDDKSYPYLALTKGDIFPALKYTREKHKARTRYFGPYTDAKAARKMIEIVRKLVPLCVSECAEWRRVSRLLKAHPEDANVITLLEANQGRPCFDYHVGKGPGVCVGQITPEAYAEHVALVEAFLSGHTKHFITKLTDEMHEAAAQLDFEKAQRIKKRIEVIQNLSAKQHVVFNQSFDADFVGIWREETIAAACVFIVREGRVIRSCEFVLDKGNEVSEQELLAGFLKQYYEQTSDIPHQINVACALADDDVFAEWLSAKAQHNVHFHVPQRGEKLRLLTMAADNAHHMLVRYQVRTGYDDKRTNAALLQLESALALDKPPMRIECFDISTIHGRFTTASMVVFTAGKPDRDQYRRFKIKTPLMEANDIVSMAEVMERRYGLPRREDPRFGSMPDLLILDGGKPQLHAAQKQLEELGVHIAMAGLAKSDEELFVLWDDVPVVLPSGSASLYLVKQVRDEAHRFAITFHRELRGKAMTVSILDEIEGVGPKRKRALLRHFGSMKKLRAASAEKIAQVPGISSALATTIYDTLQSWDEELQEVRDRAKL